MARLADYIVRIEIDALWNGHRHIVWNLRPGINILSGVNGVGKSTILHRVVNRLLEISKAERETGGVQLTFGPDGGDSVRFDVIRSFDRPIVRSEVMDKIVEMKIATELDVQLYLLQRRYLDYQVNQSKRIVALFTQGDPDAQRKAQEIAGEKQQFQDILDSLFAETGKRIDRDSNEIFFFQREERLSPDMLSSGEKQMLLILLTALVEDKLPYVLFMDEPEISLHIDWQQKLIGLVQRLNPNAQVILTTHSPAVVMDGWADCVTDVEDIIVED